MHPATLGIDTAHNVFDGRVLAGGIHGLEQNEYALAALGIELILKLSHPHRVLGAKLLVLGAFRLIDPRSSRALGEPELALAVIPAPFKPHRHASRSPTQRS